MALAISIKVYCYGLSRITHLSRDDPNPHCAPVRTGKLKVFGKGLLNFQTLEVDKVSGLPDYRNMKMSSANGPSAGTAVRNASVPALLLLLLNRERWWCGHQLG